MRWISSTAAALVVTLGCGSASADVFQLYSAGDTVNIGSAFRLTSDMSGPGYGGMYLQITSGLTVGGLTQLSADYKVTQGAFGGGSPRFTLFDASGTGAAWIYWGTPTGGGAFADPAPGVWSNTGNLVSLTSPDIRVYDADFAGSGNSGNVGKTWAAFVADHGGVTLSYITLDVDGGFVAPQQLLVNNFTVNSQVLTAAVPEPSTWALMICGFGGLAALARLRRREQPRIA